ncbi:MAG: 2-C-methyl-D-erythritol 4-phosphate cytidylyltransferase [Herbaspirillum sp.]
MKQTPHLARHFALIPAAGVGTRLGASTPKQYLPLAGKPMLQHVLDTFAATAAISHIYLVVSSDDHWIDAVLGSAPQLATRVTLLRCGGASRAQTVLNGLSAMRSELTEQDWVLVHDAARPGITGALITSLINALQNDAVGGLLALPVADSLKYAAVSNDEARVAYNVERDGLWAAQTPQMFRYGLLRRALEQSTDQTDESGAVEALGLHPKLVTGNPRNFKVTLPHDVALAELFLSEQK